MWLLLMREVLIMLLLVSQTPWTEICNKQSVLNTPLSPYIDAELLLHNHLYLDGT